MLGITSHTKVPLRLATMFGFLMSGVSMLVGLAYLVYKLLFWDRFELGMRPWSWGSSSLVPCNCSSLACSASMSALFTLRCSSGLWLSRRNGSTSRSYHLRSSTSDACRRGGNRRDQQEELVIRRLFEAQVVRYLVVGEMEYPVWLWLLRV